MDIITLFLLCALAAGSVRSSGKFIYFFTKSSQECEQKKDSPWLKRLPQKHNVSKLLQMSH